MKKFLCGICVLAAIASFAACGDGGVFPETDVKVELGEKFVLPDVGVDYDATVFDESGAPVVVQYGAFIPKVGKYVIVATVDGKEYKINVTCEDTTLPTVRFEKHLIDVSEGETVTVPNFKTEDKSGIASRSVKITDASGAEVVAENGEFVATSTSYSVIATATDNNGNVATDEAQIIVHKEFYDDDLAEGTLAAFDETDYLALVYSVDGKDGFTAKVEYGQLKLTTSLEYGDAYSTIKMPVRDFDFSKTGSVKVRVKTDKAVDFIKIEGTTTGHRAGEVFYPTPGQWYELDVDPVLLGYSYADRFTVVARSKGGATITLDEVTYTANEVDADYNGVEDFTGATPLARVFQNIYATEQYYGLSGMIGGGNTSTYSIGEKLFYGAEEPVTVLKVQTKVRYDGFTYMLPRVENADDVDSISITLSCEDSADLYVVGLFHDENKASSYTKKVKAGAIDERITLTLSGAEFRRYVDTEITGICVMVRDTMSKGVTLNVESVVVSYKQ